MAIKINITGLEDFTQKAKEAGKSLVNTPVPLGKTVLGTTLVLGAVQFYILRKTGVTLILARKT